MKEEIKKRKELRIPDYNYSEQGAYFITICTQDRKCILSKINEGENDIKINLLYAGAIAEKYIKSINNIYDNLKISYYVIMPNHIHMICDIFERVVEDADPYKCNNTILSIYI